MVHQCLEHGHNQDYVHDDRLTRWEDSQLLEEVVEQKQSMSPPFKKNFWRLFIAKHHFHFVNLPWMAEPPPQFLVHCHFLTWSKKMFQFPPESDECNYHDRYNWSCSNSRVRVPLEQMRLAKIDRDWILKGLQGNRQEEKVGFLVTEHWLELISIWMGVKGENKGCF